jgi:hypothetical protein
LVRNEHDAVAAIGLYALKIIREFVADILEGLLTPGKIDGHNPLFPTLAAKRILAPVFSTKGMGGIQLRVPLVK